MTDIEILFTPLLREYFLKHIINDLKCRSMILVSKRSYDDSIDYCGVHDLLRDLAIEKAKESKFLSVFHNQNLDETLSDARRASLQSCNFDERDNSLTSNKKLRYLLLFDKPLSDFTGFRLLKVLRVQNCSFSLKGQKWFKELILLRFLEFRNCMIEGGEIPEEIGHLKNLQTLNCTNTLLNGLPESIWSINTLRHVIVNMVHQKPYLPAPSDDLNLVNLRTLETVSIKHTQGESYSFPSLCHLALQKTDSWHPITALLKNKSLLKLVDLFINGYNFPLDVVDMRHFLFFEHLQCLKLRGTWHQGSFLSAYLFPSRLTELQLELSQLDEDPMPELGKLQNLKMLLLFGAYLGRQMTCPARGFPQLRELKLENLPAENLKIEEGTMSVLKKLKLDDLHKLKRIPDLQHLTKLEEFVWDKAPFSEGKIQMMRRENQHKLNHISIVIINTAFWFEKYN